SWTNVGTFNEPADCMNANWYNNSTITYVAGLTTPTSGWSGYTHATSGNCQGGAGSTYWVLAKHCLSNLAGQSKLKLRFTFGAGTTCNNYDGIAFDSVSIAEAPANSGNFTYSCTAPSAFSFTGASALCPDTINWNFGDAGSGSANSATGLNATHTF